MGLCRVNTKIFKKRVGLLPFFVGDDQLKIAIRPMRVTRIMSPPSSQTERAEA